MAMQKRRRSQSAATVPIALTIAGSDSSAGAGIQADLKTFSAFGVYGLSVVTCVVAEIPGKVSNIELLSAGIVRGQIDVLTNNFPIGAMKTGLLCSADIVSETATAVASLGENRPPMVVDPVIVATSGKPLLEEAAIKIYEKELFPLATLVTPNLIEAEKFSGKSVRDLDSMRRIGKELANKFGTGVLLKGGHLAGHHAIDLLFANGEVIEFDSEFVRDIATHGTGCTYSAAITAGLACGLSLSDAVAQAKEFVTTAIRRHLRWESKTGENLDALNHSPK
jgi:hydroxymethylpyrimidine/phosphomethylpyrimidine kinase